MDIVFISLYRNDIPENSFHEQFYIQHSTLCSRWCPKKISIDKKWKRDLYLKNWCRCKKFCIDYPMKNRRRKQKQWWRRFLLGKESFEDQFVVFINLQNWKSRDSTLNDGVHTWGIGRKNWLIRWIISVYRLCPTIGLP